MIGINPDCPPGVALMADHLDASLAAGEDLLASSLAARADLDEVDPQGAPEALDAFVHRLLKLEASLVLRLLQARRLSAEIARADPAMKSVAALFRAQTDALHDLIADPVRSAEGALTRAGDSHAYIRSRGLIAPEAAAPSPFETLSVDESFRVGGVAPLSQILDFVSTTLDLLDARFGLYMPDLPDEPAAKPDVSAPAALPDATDSLAKALGVVRATASLLEGRAADNVGKSAPKAKPDDAVEAPTARSAETDDTKAGIADAASASDSAGPAPSDAKDKTDKKSEQPRRPAGYRSLSSLIAEVQQSPDRP